MQPTPATADAVEDLQRTLAFADACSDVLDFDHLLARASAHLHTWAQADVVTLILPPEREGVEPMLHVFGRQPVLPVAEQSVREGCAELLAALDFAQLPAEALRVRRGPELTPLHGAVRDDALYPFWSAPLTAGEAVVGVVALFGFTDWILSVRSRRLLDGLMPVLAQAVQHAAAVEGLRACAQKDALTGGYNRRGFTEVLGRACAEAAAYDAPLSLVLFAVEGPAMAGAGAEAALRAVGEVVQAGARAFDVFGRYGAAELVLLLPRVGLAEAGALAERLVAVARRVTVDGAAVRVCAGAALYRGGSAAALVQAADEALDQARRPAARAAGQG